MVVSNTESNTQPSSSTWLNPSSWSTNSWSIFGNSKQPEKEITNLNQNGAAQSPVSEIMTRGGRKAKKQPKKTTKAKKSKKTKTAKKSSYSITWPKF